MQNLLKHHTAQAAHSKSGFGLRWSRVSKFHKILLSMLLFFVTLFGVLALWGIVNIRAAKGVYVEALAAKQSFEYAQVAIANQDFARAEKDLGEASAHFAAAQDRFKRFQVYRVVPGLARQMKAIDSVLQAGASLSSGLQKLAVVGGRVTSVIPKDASGSFADISPDEKRAVLQQLSESSTDLHGVKSEVELAVLLIDDIPDRGLLRAVRAAVQPVKEQLPLLESLIYQAIPAAETLPSILGYPVEKTYLFLLQNNRELRPTGGFIGTYGILKLNAGEIHTFETDNIYNLDNQAKDTVTEPSPKPIAEHTKTQNWLLRNINWSPDFPTTAQKAESKYYEEGGSEQDVDGVIAVTPTFIESLLRLTGLITVDGIEFTAENLFETLEYQVEFGYYQQGISDAARKEVIGHLSSELMDRLLGMQRTELPRLWETFVENVDSKQILIYVDDQITQELVLEQNWGGEMKHYASDFVMVVDANLAALKTDEKMERSLSYTMSRQGDDYVGNVDMLYVNTTQRVSDFYTRYRTYTRIYVPYGSELVSSEGFLTNDIKVNHGRPTEPEVYEESFTRPDGSIARYTVVGGFTSIEPKEERHLKITYRLPATVKEQIHDGTYALSVQKQAGTINHGLNVSVDIGRGIELTAPLDIRPEHVDNRMSIQSDLTEDRSFEFSFY